MPVFGTEQLRAGCIQEREVQDREKGCIYPLPGLVGWWEDPPLTLLPSPVSLLDVPSVRP